MPTKITLKDIREQLAGNLAFQQGINKLSSFILDRLCRSLNAGGTDFKFSLKDQCEKMGLNYTTAKQLWISGLRSKGFTINRTDTHGVYSVTDYCNPDDQDWTILRAVPDSTLKQWLESIAREAEQALKKANYRAGGKVFTVADFRAIISDMVYKKELTSNVKTIIKGAPSLRKRILMAAVYCSLLNKTEIENPVGFWCDKFDGLKD
jgi:hypothetical protein